MAKHLLRLGLHSPDPDDHEITWLGGAYDATASTVRHMRGTIREYNRLTRRHPDVAAVLAIFKVRRKRARKA
jgi:hypothetical protein